jgi:uncharacterized protein (DUF305 family)
MKVSLRRSTESPGEGTAPRRRRWPSLTPVLTAILIVGAVILGAVVGAALVSLFFQDTAVDGTVEAGAVAPGEDSAEAGFSRDMMVHHAQAVQMAEIVRDKTESQEIRSLAADIALTQQAQIGQMQGWLQVWGLPATGYKPAMTWMGHPTEDRMPGMASPEDIDNLQKASSEEADVLFLQLMIPHHEAAVPMAEAVLESTDRPEVRRLAGAIIASQQAEIELMKGLLQMRGAAPIEEESHAHGGAPHGGE